MNKPKSVVEDLIGRLENSLPGMKKKDEKEKEEKDFPFEETKEEERLYPTIELTPVPQEEKEQEVPEKPEANPLPKSDTGPYDSLKEIVDEFNSKLTAWYEETGCVVNFSWSYADGKKLEISGIDYIVYRKAAPSPETVKSILAKG